MARTITVRPGETLSSIAARHGVSVGSITGFRSGNPNLIFPGEVLTIGGGGGGGAARPGGAASAPTTPFSKFQAKSKSIVAAAQKKAAAREKAARARRKKEQTAFTARQKAEEQAFLGRFRETVGGFEPLSALRGRLASELGLPEAREAQTGLNQAVIGLQGTIANLPEQLEERARGTFATQAQIQSLQQARTDPLSRQLIELARTGAIRGEQLGELETQLGTRLSDVVAEQRQQLAPLELEADFLSERLAREASAYSQQRQEQFELMLNQIQAGQRLTESQVNVLANLAIQEQEFLDQKELIRFEQQFKGGGDEGDIASRLQELLRPGATAGEGGVDTTDLGDAARQIADASGGSLQEARRQAGLLTGLTSQERRSLNSRLNKLLGEVAFTGL